jgi:hypothetical protein
LSYFTFFIAEGSMISHVGYHARISVKMAVAVQDQKYQGDCAMQISILIRLTYLPKSFQKQDLAVAKARVVVI